MGAGIIDTGLVAAQLDERAGFQVVTGREDWLTLNARFQCGAGGGAYGLIPGPDGAGELSFQELAALGLLDGPIRVVVDPMPSCSEDPLPEDGTGKIQLLLFGTATFDVANLDLPTVRLSGAPVLAHQVLDYDVDEFDDIVLEVDVADRVGHGTVAAIILEGAMIGGERVVGGRPMYWVPTAVDQDLDGVPDDCDRCPAPGPPASPTGCP